MKDFLESEKITQTITRLAARINDRFPDASLHNVCKQLEGVSEKAAERSEWIGRPVWWIRAAGLLLAAGAIALIVLIVFSFDFENEQMTPGRLIELADSATAELLLIGAMFFFLFTLERRLKRARVLTAIHQLRSIAHIIDMHQLTKDPERIVSKLYTPTQQSPKTKLDKFQLRRYLDYCSEMLALTSKVAAVHIQHFDDSAALQAVNEIEQLTTGLSRKIWQKIMILHALADESPGNNTTVEK